MTDIEAVLPYPLIKAGAFAIIRVEENVSLQNLQRLSSSIQQMGKKIAKLLVFDCSKIKKVPDSFCGVVLALHNNLSGQKKKLIVINVSADLKNIFAQAGLLRTLLIYQDFYEFSDKEHVREGLRINLDAVDAFVIATKSVFQTMVGIEVVPKTFFILSKKFPLDGLIIATIQMKAVRIDGLFSLCLSNRFFLNVVGKMLGETYTEVKQELLDAVSEMVNMIFGQAKTLLNQQKYELQMAIPKLQTKASPPAESSAAGHENYVLIPYTSPLGSFFVEFRF